MFNEFRATHGLPRVWPSPPQHILHFAASLSLSGKSHSTARTYLAGLSAKHKLNGWDDPTDNFLLKKLFQGLAKTDCRKDNRLPVTFQKLRQLIAALPAVCSSSYEVKLFTSVYTLAFFGFFRVSELVGQHQASKRGREGLTLSSLELGDKLCVTLAGSKTDQQNRGAEIQISRVTGFADVCPVLALSGYLHVRGARPGPLFTHFSGKPLTRYQFQAVLKKAAAVLSWDTRNYSSHSFRIGAATTAALNGLPLDEIMAKGRWKSAAVNRYVRL